MFWAWGNKNICYVLLVMLGSFSVLSVTLFTRIDGMSRSGIAFA